MLNQVQHDVEMPTLRHSERSEGSKNIEFFGLCPKTKRLILDSSPRKGVQNDEREDRVQHDGKKERHPERSEGFITAESKAETMDSSVAKGSL